MRDRLHAILAAALVASSGPSAIAPPAMAAAAAPSAGGACDVAAIKPPPNTTLLTAKAFTAPVPYCRIDGYVTTTNPGPNKVRFMLALPQSWNGRYLFTVQGGAAGFVPDPTEPHLRDGYAIASTDKGVVTAGILDFSFQSNPAMALDWAHRGVHVATEATQAIARSYYGRAKLNRYVMGCSGGGDGTLVEAEMYPRDFDAYIGGAMNTDYPYGSTLVWAAVGQRVNRVPGAWISPAEYDQIYKALLAKYDASDGAVDGLIWDPTVIKLDAGDRATLSFLSDAQFGTLKLIQQGVSTADGKLLAPGYWMANPKLFPNFLTGKTPPPWKTQAEQPAGYIVADTSSKARAGQQFSFITDVDFAKLGDEVPGIERTKFDHHKLAGLQKAGGKLILWVGGAEEAVSEQQILGYTERASATFGPAKDHFFRTFVVPGMHHCGRGENAPTDTSMGMLRAAEAWVEKGRAPDAVVLTATEPKRSYLLCPFPQRSVFKGGVANPQKLDVDDARNWSCHA